MINIYNKSPSRITSLLWVAAVFSIFSVSAPAALAKASPHYKQKSVVDFDDAVVEGKSRKPYSTYLSKENEGNFSDVNSWSLDFSKRLKHSQLKAELNP